MNIKVTFPLNFSKEDVIYIIEENLKKNSPYTCNVMFLYEEDGENVFAVSSNDGAEAFYYIGMTAFGILAYEESIRSNNFLCYGINRSAGVIFEKNKAKGFWDKERNVGELLMLVVSELGEAIEAHRKGKFADVKNFEDVLDKSRIINNDPTYTGLVTPESAYAAHFKRYMKDTFEDEIADAIIRLLDLSAGLSIDLEKHINAKVRYNETREKLHGKQY